MSLPLKGIVLSVALTLALPRSQLLADDFADGLAALGMKTYAQAILLLTQVFAQNQNNAKAFLARGVAYRGIGELDKALADCDEAIRLDPKNSAAYLTGAVHGTPRASSTRQLPISTRRFASPQRILAPSLVVAAHGPTRAILNRHWLISTRRFGSTQNPWTR